MKPTLLRPPPFSKARLLLNEFNRDGTLKHMLLSYTNALIKQASQIAVCNRYHSAEQKLCRWLLLTLDRIPSNELFISHDLLARMLGVHSGVAMDALEKLQRAGLILHSRGHIAVVDRYGLEDYACECYGVVKREIDHLLGLEWEWNPVIGNVISRSVGKHDVGVMM